MKILLGDRGRVDFSAPVSMSENQRDRFMDLLKELFSFVEIESPYEDRTERLGDGVLSEKWSNTEKIFLIESAGSTEAISDKLGRSWLSVYNKRGPLVANYLTWLTRKGKKLDDYKKKDLIEEFLRESKKRKGQKLEKILKRTKILNCPKCGLSIRANLVDKNKAECGVCKHQFDVEEEQIED